MRLSEILDWHQEHYPLLQAEDIYKLIYQGVFGPGHIITDEERAKRRLMQEVAQTKFDYPVEEIEPVDPDGVLIRVNLKPIADSGARLNRLLSALLQTGKEFLPRPDLLPERLILAQEWCGQRLPEQVERLRQLVVLAPIQPRHSDIYLKNYTPAYRVVLVRYWLT